MQPVDRSGAHVSFVGLRSGLRLDAAIAGGIVLPFDDGPPRLKGGRGAWPDLVAAADAALVGQRVEGFRVAPSTGAFSLDSGDFSLALVGGPGRLQGLVFRGEGAAPRVMPPLGRDQQARLVSALEALEGPAALTRALRMAVSLRPPEAHDFLDAAREALGAWPRAAVDALLAGEGASVAERAEALAERLEEGRSARGALIGDELAASYPEARRAALEERRFADARALLKAETRRVRRALDAVARDEARAKDPAQIRAQAEALLAAGPALELRGEVFVVPDLHAPGSSLEVRRDPPDAGPHQVADKLFMRARKESRSVEGRAERRAFLEQRLEGLTRASEAEGVEALEEALRALGLGAGLEAGPPAASAVGKRKGKPATSSIRVFRSPGGFEVLAGRNARQNDRLTFKVAAPGRPLDARRGHAGQPRRDPAA